MIEMCGDCGCAIKQQQWRLVCVLSCAEREEKTWTCRERERLAPRGSLIRQDLTLLTEQKTPRGVSWPQNNHGDQWCSAHREACSPDRDLCCVVLARTQTLSKLPVALSFLENSSSWRKHTDHIWSVWGERTSREHVSSMFHEWRNTRALFIK